MLHQSNGAVFIPIKKRKKRNKTPLGAFNSISSHLISYRKSFHEFPFLLSPHMLIPHAHPIPSHLISPSPSFSLDKAQAKSNPKPFIQARYLVTISAHAACGSLAVEKSMHSSRAAFSSLHTQQGLTLGAPSSPGGLFEEARLLIWEEAFAF